jgi:hypothetical protein
VGVSGLGGGEYEAGEHEQARDQPYESGHLDVSHPETPPQAMSKRSVWTRSPGTPNWWSAASTASIIGPGPQMKN